MYITICIISMSVL